MSFIGRCCYVTTLLYIVIGVAAYQFEVDDLIRYEEPGNLQDKKFRGSYFGYSVSLWANSKNSWVLIGAPRANSSLYQSIDEPGTVYKCGIHELCTEWLVSNNPAATPQDGSWLGGSIATETIKTRDGRLIKGLVCAHRWVNSSLLADMRGMCYSMASDSSDSIGEMGKEVPQLIGAKAQIGNLTLYAMGQSGFSIHIVPEQKYLILYLLGVPGAYQSHGTPIISHHGSFNIPNLPKDKSVGLSSYSGYAVTSGDYFGAKKLQYATGAPKADSFRGKVVLFDFAKFAKTNPKPIKEITHIIGDQTGEYFGSALATCNIDGDKKKDLLVGAPQWSKDSDEGRIYIFRDANAKTKNFAIRTAIDGTKLKGRFGSAIRCLGDIDYDGYDDFAVGAPYDGNGTVYIYHGGKNGARLTQTISAPQNTKGFGISISEARDIDKNNYVDIAVGAYISGNVILFRSKRVVNMTVTLSNFGSAEPLNRNSSFSVEICPSYNGTNAPAKLPVSIELEIKGIARRAVIDANNKTVYKFNETLTFGELKCSIHNISINPRNEDFLNPLKLTVTQRLNTLTKNGSWAINDDGTSIVDSFSKFAAITNETHKKVQDHLEVLFAVYCGQAGICNSNLSIYMTTNLANASKFVIGSERIVRLNIEVTNTGDQAYGTKAVVYIPHDIRLSHKPTICEEANDGDNNRVTCFIGNPLGRNEMIKFDLDLDMSSVPSTKDEILLHAEVATQSENLASENDTTIAIKCLANTDIGIAGNSETDYLHYTLEGKKEDLLDISFQHTFEIKNYETTPIAGAIVSVSFPTHWIHGSDKIEVVRLNKRTAYLDNKEFYCPDTEEVADFSPMSSIPQKDKKFITIKGETLAASLDNRTLHINCSNPSFAWKTINCEIKEFETARSSAKLVLQFDLLLPNFTPEIIQNKDIIFFVANASTRLLYDITQSVNNKADSVLIGTTFIGSALGNPLPSWLIPTSVFGGLLILIIIILGLLKLGFFKRNKKAKLEELLSEANDMSPVVLIETFSSTEALDVR